MRKILLFALIVLFIIPAVSEAQIFAHDTKKLVLLVADFDDSLNNEHIITALWNFLRIKVDTLAAGGTIFYVEDSAEFISPVEFLSTVTAAAGLTITNVATLDSIKAVGTKITVVDSTEFLSIVVIDSTNVPNTLGLSDMPALEGKFLELLLTSAYGDSMANLYARAVTWAALQTMEAGLTISGGNLTVAEDVSIQGATLPNLDVSFGAWQGLPNYLPTVNDTLEVIALYDSVGVKFVPVIKGMHPDTGSVIQTLYTFSEVFNIPAYFTGVDSVVFEYITGNASTDSNAVAVIIYEYTDGALTSLDNTSAAANVTWTHDATLTSLTDLIRYDKFVIAIQLKSMRDYCWAKIGRVKIYWKESS